MNTEPPIDSVAIRRLTEWGGDDLPRKLIDIFLSHGNDRMQQIRDGLSNGDAKMAETGAHSLKSSAGNLGARTVQALSAEAERLAEDADLEGLRERLPALEEAFSAACRALGTIREEMQG